MQIVIEERETSIELDEAPIAVKLAPREAAAAVGGPMKMSWRATPSGTITEAMISLIAMMCEPWRWWPRCARECSDTLVAKAAKMLNAVIVDPRQLRRDGECPSECGAMWRPRERRSTPSPWRSLSKSGEDLARWRRVAKWPAGACEKTETDAGRNRADLVDWRGVIGETDPALDSWRPKVDLAEDLVQRCPVKVHGDEYEYAAAHE